ncbi:hypothetical protein EG327_010657, partial [Venturia inaequalis]
MDLLKAAFCCFDGGEDSIYSEAKYFNEADSDSRPLLEKQPLNEESATPVYSTFVSGAHLSNPEDIVVHVTSTPPPADLHYEYHHFNYSVKEKKAADEIVKCLYAAGTWEVLQEQFCAEEWTETLARLIIDGLVDAINSGKVMDGAISEAYENVAPGVEDFVHGYPLLTAVTVTLIAISILEYLVPSTISALGFGELGPIHEGSYAAWWQSLYGDVPYGSLFSFIQSGKYPKENIYIDGEAPDHEAEAEYVWQGFSEGKNDYLFGSVFERTEAENLLVNDYILPHLLRVDSRTFLDEAFYGIRWTNSLTHTLFNALKDIDYSWDCEWNGLMKEAHDKASASATAMGFLVGAPTSSSATHLTEGSLDPFIVDLGMLSIMVPAIFEEESVQESLATFRAIVYSGARYTPAEVSCDSLSTFVRDLAV